MRYKNDVIMDIWSDKNKFQIWSDIELAYIRILKKINVDNITIKDKDVLAINKIEDTTKHDVAAFVQWLEKKFKRKDWSRFIHYGLTSSDIVDTAFTIQIANSNTEINRLVDVLINNLRNLPKCKVVGRTHGQIAELREFKSKVEQYCIILENLKPSYPEYGKLSGSVGDYKHVPKNIETLTLNSIGLKPSDMVDGQVISRAYYAHYALEWAQLATYIEKVATDFRILAQTEIGEISEQFSSGQIGSSSMPHKENPISLENICGNARIIKNLAASALDSVVIWNERDISHSSMERTIYPQASNLLAYIINRFSSVVCNMNIDTIKMENRADEYFDVLNSQAAMLQKIERGSSRKDAHERVGKSKIK